jgi:5'-3' exonuclease
LDKSPVLVIDADPAVYQAGFASQCTVHHYVYTDADGEMHQEVWKDGNDARKFFRENPTYEVLDHSTELEVRPEGFARQAAKTVLQKCVRAAAKMFEVGVNDITVEVVLSGPDNFRLTMATIKEYKANRKAAKPEHYNVIRSYISDQWNAQTVHGWEADDEVSIRCRQLAADGVPFLLATIDKDLDQVPGPHFDYRQSVHYDIDAASAHQLFWVQLIAGDSTDNIQGCYRLGVGKAETMVAGWIEEYEEGVPEYETHVAKTLDHWLWYRSVETYAANMEKYPDKFPEGMSPAEAAIENARLVYMLEREGELWTPPGEPHGVLDYGN